MGLLRRLFAKFCCLPVHRGRRRGAQQKLLPYLILLDGCGYRSLARRRAILLWLLVVPIVD